MKNIAIKAARQAGSLLMQQLENISNANIDKVLKNISTKADKDSEILIKKIILSEFTDHDFLGEEFGEQNLHSPYKWIIDPLDGTNNYISGRDNFSVSIALEHNKQIILGVVYLPKRDEMFIAEKDKGATLNEEPIKISEEDTLSKAVVTYSTYPGEEIKTEVLNNKILSAIPNIKFFGFQDKKDVDEVFGRGSMAAEFCYLACGRIDGLIRLKQKPWDVAAGSLIAAEAGSKMVDLKGDECSVYEGDYIAANPELLNKFLQIIKE